MPPFEYSGFRFHERGVELIGEPTPEQRLECMRMFMHLKDDSEEKMPPPRERSNVEGLRPQLEGQNAYPILDLGVVHAYLNTVVEQYRQSAPMVSAWAVGLRNELRQALRQVAVFDLVAMQALYNGVEWEPPDLALERVYALMDEIGEDPAD